MKIAIPQKGTLFRSKLKLVRVIWAQIGPTSTTKDPKRAIVSFHLEETFQRSGMIYDFARGSIDQVGSSHESLIPILEGHRGLC